MFTRKSQSTTSAPKHKFNNKLIAGFAALLATTVITASGFAAATSNNDKPSREWCRQAGFTNYGQCVKEWARNKNRPGNGYGSDNSIITNISLALNNSNNNVIQIVINVFR